MPEKYLGKTAILGAKLRTKEVDVPEWGGMLLIREPSALAAAMIADLPDDTPHQNRTAWWFVLCVVDKDGELAFTVDDIPALVELSWSVLSDVVSEILDFSGLAGND